MKSFKALFAISFGTIFAAEIALLNLIENVVNEKLTFSGAFFSENLTLACVVRVLLFAAIIVLSVFAARLATRLAAAFACKSGKGFDDGNFFGLLFAAFQIAFVAYVALRLYFGVKKLNVTSTAFLLMGINDFTFVLMLMRIFTYIANIIYALSGVCALSGCANYAKQLIDKTTTKDID